MLIRNMLRRVVNFLAPPPSVSTKELDLSEVSQSMAQQLLEKPMTDLERRTIKMKEAAALKKALETPPFRNFSEEHRAHLERYTPEGDLKSVFLQTEVPTYSPWPTGERGRPPVSDDDFMEQLMAQRRLDEKREAYRQARQLEADRAAAEAAELEAIAQMAVAEADSRYSRF